MAQRMSINGLIELLKPERLTEVVDIGANPIDGDPPYKGMLGSGACNVTGFEPQEAALARLLGAKGKHENYLPYAVGDGGEHTLNVCQSSGMTSLLEPDASTLKLFERLEPHGKVVNRIPVKTKRLDDMEEIKVVDFLKIDIQGGELDVFRGGAKKLLDTVVIQSEVPFVTLYRGQPSYGDIDIELRKQGFIPHCFDAVKQWVIGSCIQNSKQLLEADAVYVRDFSRLELMTSEQLKHLALIVHGCYNSFDLALYCIRELEKREAVGAGTSKAYSDSLSESGVDEVARGASYWFDLGQGHYRTKNYVEAKEAYQKCIAMRGQNNYRFCALFMLAECEARLDSPEAAVIEAYMDAYNADPTRAEPLYAIACYYRGKKKYELGYIFAKQAINIPLPAPGSLFVLSDVYEYQALDELSVCAYYTENHVEEGYKACQELAQKKLPQEIRNRVTSNLELYQKKLERK